jgi:hypothetical protein
LILFIGCLHSTDPTQQNSCNTNTPYPLAMNSHWLRSDRSLFSLSAPSNPLVSVEPFNYADTTFMDSTRQYSLQGNQLSFGLAGGKDYPNAVSLVGHPSHIAIADGLVYVLRHTSTEPSTMFCSQRSDSVNELDIEQFSDTSTQAILLAQIPLTDPTGIAVKDSTLYVLDASNGLHVFSLSNPEQPHEIAHLTSVQGYHLQVTPQSTLLVTSSAGIAQYDISNPASVTLLSRIQ